MRSFLSLALLLSAIVLPASMPARAQQAATQSQSQSQSQSQAAQPAADAVPALAAFFRDGQTRGFYMGRAAGLDGWFLMMSEKRVQIAYTAPDGNILVIGALFSADGTNITEQQLIGLRAKEPAVNALFTDTVQQAQETLVRASGMDRVMKNLDPAKKGDQLYLELAQAFHAQLGARDAPLLFMVIDPNCPHCKRAWKAMAPWLAKTNVQVRVIPVGILGDDSTRMAGKLLDTDKPGALWAKFAAADFDRAVLDGSPGEDGRAKAQVNRALFDRWQLKATPFFAYRAKNGDVKVLNQVPDDARALLEDIAAVPPPVTESVTESAAKPAAQPATQPAAPPVSVDAPAGSPAGSPAPASAPAAK